MYHSICLVISSEQNNLVILKVNSARTAMINVEDIVSKFARSKKQINKIILILSMRIDLK